MVKPLPGSVGPLPLAARVRARGHRRFFIIMAVGVNVVFVLVAPVGYFGASGLSATNPGWLTWWPTTMGESWIPALRGARRPAVVDTIAGILWLVAGAALIAADLAILLVLLWAQRHSGSPCVRPHHRVFSVLPQGPEADSGHVPVRLVRLKGDACT